MVGGACGGWGVVWRVGRVAGGGCTACARQLAWGRIPKAGAGGHPGRSTCICATCSFDAGEASGRRTRACEACLWHPAHPPGACSSCTLHGGTKPTCMPPMRSLCASIRHKAASPGACSKWGENSRTPPAWTPSSRQRARHRARHRARGTKRASLHDGIKRHANTHGRPCAHAPRTGTRSPRAPCTACSPRP